MTDLSISISCESLVASGASGNRPLPGLTLDDHIHGELRLKIGGRLVPHLGFHGPGDVCINTWLGELSAAAQAFQSGADARYTFDEGEQGQPAFVFERAGDLAYFTIADAAFSGGCADPAWQRVAFSPADFLVEHTAFRESLFSTIRTTAPGIADPWIRQQAPYVRVV